MPAPSRLTPDFQTHARIISHVTLLPSSCPNSFSAPTLHSLAHEFQTSKLNYKALALALFLWTIWWFYITLLPPADFETFRCHFFSFKFLYNKVIPCCISEPCSLSTNKSSWSSMYLNIADLPPHSTHRAIKLVMMMMMVVMVTEKESKHQWFEESTPRQKNKPFRLAS